MKIKVDIEVDGILLARLEDERPNISADSVSVISNMARVEAREQIEEYLKDLNVKREKAKAAKNAERNEE